MGRVGIVEVMGRGAGHITLEAGVAGGAHITLIREFHIPADALIKRVEEVFAERGYVLIALAEAYNAYDPNVEPADSSEMVPHGHAKLKDAGRLLEKLIKERTKLGTQLQVVGYNVRSSEPLALDGNFARDLGAMAGHLAHTGQYGKMASLINGKITSVDLAGVKGGRNVTNLQYDQKLMMKRDEPPEVVQQLLEAESSVLYGQI